MYSLIHKAIVVFEGWLLNMRDNNFWSRIECFILQLRPERWIMY